MSASRNFRANKQLGLRLLEMAALGCGFSRSSDLIRQIKSESTQLKCRQKCDMAGRRIYMLSKIQKFLLGHPKANAKTIAKKLFLEKSVVNKVRYEHKNVFTCDTEFAWSLLSKDLIIRFPECSWLTSEIFEHSLSGFEVIDGPHEKVIFVVAKDCQILLEALARLLAICNQLATKCKGTSIDFSNCRKSIGYFDRVGFFDHLDSNVSVQPYRPTSSKARAFAGNNNNVVEFRSIDPIAPDRKIPENLKDSFEVCAGENYSSAAFTILSELFGNVQEHSGSTTAGFAALQAYGGRHPHIQTVISDNGLGIVGTLMPLLAGKYPRLFEKINSSKLDHRIELLKEVFTKGGFSRSDDDARGLGLKRSAGLAEKFKAKISVRQETYELRVNYIRGNIQFCHSLNLTKIDGTHICFDFLLDEATKSG